MDMREVYSSSVNSVGYDNGLLVVEWKNGRRSSFDRVPPALADEVMNAPSVGKALRQSVQGSYPHKYL